MSQEENNENEEECYLCSTKDCRQVQTEWNLKRIIPKYFSNIKPSQYDQLCQSCIDYIVNFDRCSTRWEGNEQLIKTMRKFGHFKGLKYLVNLKKTSSQICRLCFKETDTEDAIYIYHENQVYQRGYIRKILALHSPITDLSLTENPIICNICLDAIQTFDAFKEMCLHIQTAKSWSESNEQDEEETQEKNTKKGTNKEVTRVQLNKTSDSTVGLRNVTETESAVSTLINTKDHDKLDSVINRSTIKNRVDLPTNKHKVNNSAPERTNDIVIISDEEDTEMASGQCDKSPETPNSNTLNTSKRKKKKQQLEVNKKHKIERGKKIKDKIPKTSKQKEKKSKSKCNLIPDKVENISLVPVEDLEDCEKSLRENTLNNIQNLVVEVDDSDSVSSEDSHFQKYSNQTSKTTENTTIILSDIKLNEHPEQTQSNKSLINDLKTLETEEFLINQKKSKMKNNETEEDASIYPVIEINMTEVKKILQSPDSDVIQPDRVQSDPNPTKILEINVEGHTDSTERSRFKRKNNYDITGVSEPSDDDQDGIEVVTVEKNKNNDSMSNIKAQNTKNPEEIRYDLSDFLDFNQATSVAENVVSSTVDELSDFTIDNGASTAVSSGKKRVSINGMAEERPKIPSEIKTYNSVYENFVHRLADFPFNVPVKKHCPRYLKHQVFSDQNSNCKNGSEKSIESTAKRKSNVSMEADLSSDESSGESVIEVPINQNCNLEEDMVCDEVITIDDDKNFSDDASQYCIYYPYKKNLKDEHFNFGNKQPLKEKKVHQAIIMEKRNGARLYVCLKCNSVMKLQKQLQNHFCSFQGRQKQKRDSSNFKCTEPNCNYFTFSQEYLTRHEISHKVFKECTLKCNYCEYYTSDNSALELHKMARHEKGEVVMKNNRCPYCGFSTNLKSILSFHIISRHKEGTRKFTKNLQTAGKQDERKNPAQLLDELIENRLKKKL